MSQRSENQKSVAAAPLHDDPQRPGKILPPEVSGLLQTAAELRHEADPTWAAHVVEANEQLILASLHAEKMRETAAYHLDQLTRVGQRDALTDMPNRALMFDRLERAVATAKRNRARIAVLFVDLDDFKQINDTRGHAAGDEVLKSAARALESVLRRSDTVSRHGGDEFLVLLPEILHSSSAALIATKMLAALATPVRVGADMVSLSASIGIAIFPDDGDDAATLIHCADNAMYRSKRRASGHYAFYRAELEQLHAHAHTAAELSQLRGASLSDHELRTEAHLRSVALGEEKDAARREAFRRESMFQEKVANALRSPFTATKDSLELLSQVQTEEPLLRVLIDREVAHLSAPLYESFGTPHSSAGAFMRFDTVKTGKFDAIDADGVRCTVLEFTVTARCGMQDQTRRSMSERSFGLANGDRVNQVSFADFQNANSGVLMHRV